MNKSVAFIILNYKSTNDTLECIDSINSIKTDILKKIIVVDNASLNEEDKKIIDKKADDLLLLDENVGYAKGNNYGCKFAIDKYSPDFLLVINSDIIINEKNFIDNIYVLYDKYNFDILGPKILPDDTNSVNPFPAYKTLDEVNERINYTKKLIRIYENPILRNILKLYLNIKRKFRKEVYLKNGEKDIVGCPLHGCALIFSKKYYEKFNDVFYDKTFLFHEEEFLYYRCVKANLVSLYSNQIKLIHKEGQSLNKSFKVNYKKEIFRNKEILKSLLLLKDVMEKNELI